MALAILSIIAALNILLTVLTLQKIIGKPWIRQYYVLVVLLILNLLQIVPPIASFADRGNWELESAQRLYWSLYFLFELAIYVFVIQMAYRVATQAGATRNVVRLLPLAAFVCLVATLTIHNHHARLNTYMTLVIRDMTFLAAMMNLILWRFLGKMPKKDFLLLTVCSGLGIQCSGDAIGHSIRHFTPRQYAVADWLLSVCGILAISIWYMGFSKSQRSMDRTRGRTPAKKALPPEAVPENHDSAACDATLAPPQPGIPSV